MFGYFRRKREAIASGRIAEAIAAHALYEREHSARQLKRLAGFGPDHEKRSGDAGRHGKYDPDQTKLAVFQRAVRLYTHAKQKPPKWLWRMVCEALEGLE